ncbi:ASB18 protein, partial [Ptilonorhynchus violaceus]|nr:ASB18 protein [Ptilonorhynchus violaceus]
MSELPGLVTGKLRISSKLDSEHPFPARAPIARFYTALVTGDLRSLQVLTDQHHQDVNLVFEISKDELEWQAKSQASYGLSGLWSLEERRELSTPLCLAARHGHPDCLRHLLRRGADPNLAPGGRGPLHEACLGGHSDCVELLLEYRADPNLRSDEGTAPLHLCTTRDSLGGAGFASKLGKKNMQKIYIRNEPLWLICMFHSLGSWKGKAGRGGETNRRFFLKKTGCPSGVLGQESSSSLRCPNLLLLLLVVHGIPFLTESHFPSLGVFLPSMSMIPPELQPVGAILNAIDYDGLTPLGCALQGAASHREWRPHVTVQLLLNHGSRKIWPQAFVKVLKSCAAVPEVIEVLFNSYSQIPVSQEWAKAVPEEVFQEHQAFYESLFQLAGAVRCLQHLCRSALRTNFGSKCHSLIPLLPVPKALHDYLLLEPEGVVL